MTIVPPNRTGKIARISTFSGLAVAGSFLSLPSLVSSVALDSASGYFSALSFGETEAIAVLFLGHLATGIVHGFPLGVLHIPIAIGLGFQGWVMAKVSKRLGKPPSTIVGIAINTGLTTIVVPFFGIDALVAFAPIVFIGSLVNGALAYVVAQSVDRLGLVQPFRERLRR
jgi:riboflavin transporter